MFIPRVGYPSVFSLLKDMERTPGPNWFWDEKLFYIILGDSGTFSLVLTIEPPPD